MKVVEGARFTRGPWVAREDGGRPVPMYTIYHDETQGFAVSPRVYHKADADLIAAAPDLFEALNGLMGGIFTIVNYVQGGKVDTAGMLSILGASMDEARDALKKATGEMEPLT